MAKEEAARQAHNALGWATGASGPYHCTFSQRFEQGQEGADREIITHQEAVRFCLFERRVLSMYIR